MKLFFFTIFTLFLISYTLNAQNTSESKCLGKIGFTFSSFGENDIIRNENIVGGASYIGDNFYSIGINYLNPINTWLDFETGIEYSNHKIIIKPNVPPNMDNTPYGRSFSLINIPITLRVNFLKYCFVNGGLLFDIDAGTSSPIDSQTGIGGSLGFGIKYDFNIGMSVFVNPYFKMHSLIPFSAGEDHQRIMETGFRFGIMYKLK